MKTAAAILLLAVFAASAQTNLFISFTNNSGIFVTNAEVTKIFPNKIIYHTDAGGGMIAISKLPPEIQTRLGFDTNAAAAADEVDKQKKEADQQRQAELQLASRTAANREAIKQNILSQGVEMSGDVIQKVKEGLLVSWPGTTEDPPTMPSTTILLVDYPKFDSTASEDTVEVSKIYPVGLYVYTTVNGSEKTVRKWTCDLERAVDAALLK
jgi:hypothetical protein